MAIHVLPPVTRNLDEHGRHVHHATCSCGALDVAGTYDAAATARDEHWRTANAAPAPKKVAGHLTAEGTFARNRHSRNTQRTSENVHA